MQTTDTTPAQAPQPAELTERELNEVAGGLLPAVAPVKGKCPTAVE